MAKQDDNARPLKVAIVGTGNVGATYAYALVLSGLVAEIVLINRDQEVAKGEAMDLTHATSLTASTRVTAGTYADCKDAVVTVLTAGVPQGDKASRLKLVAQNGEVFQSIVPPVIEHNPEGLLLIATNPVDVLTYAAWKISGLDASKVIGSGTVLDSARLRSLLAARLSLDPHSVDAFVIGEHGDSQVPVWSLANIGGTPLAKAGSTARGRLKKSDLTSIAKQTRTAGRAVAGRKGATYYGVAASLVRITQAIVRDERSVLTVSTVIERKKNLSGVALSMPAVIGRHGIERILYPPLNDAETRDLHRSAATVRKTIRQLSLA